MNKNLIYKILGALSCALIIVSIFVPFISYEGFSQSLFDSYKILGYEYIVYILILACLLGIIIFAIGKHTEISYFTAGMVMFFILREVIEIINNNGFDLLGAGFYFIVIGEILLLIMTILSKKKNNIF